MKKALPAANESYNSSKPDTHTKLIAVLRILICFLFIFLPYTSHTYAAYEYESPDYLTSASENHFIPSLESEIVNPLPFSGKLLISPIYVYRNESEKEGEAYNKVGELLSQQLINAKTIYQQIGITVDSLAIYSVPEIHVDGFPEGQFFYDENNIGREDKIIEHLNRYVLPLTTNAVPVFLVPTLGSSTLAGKTMTQWLIDNRRQKNILILQPGSFIPFNEVIQPDTLAHELGHFLLNDRFFYPAMSRDETRQHLWFTNYLMSAPERTDRTSSIIDFHPMVRQDHGTIDEMLAGRMNQAEVMYSRSGFIDKPDVSRDEADVLQIYMPNFKPDPDTEEQVVISPRDGSKSPPSFFMPYFIKLAWGGDRHMNITLSEYWDNGDVIDQITNIQVSSWARVVQDSGKIEYCIDIYFNEPFNYFPYGPGNEKMVPDAYSNNENLPYFALIMSKFADSFVEFPQVRVFKYVINENYSPDKEHTDIEFEKEINPIPSEDGPFFHDIFWIKLNLEDMRDVTHLRWTWQ